MTKETIWRDYIPANYLTEDYFEQDQDRILTIKSVGTEDVENPKIKKKEEKMVVHFEEDVPPMIFNKTNSKAVQRVTGTPKVAEWIGVRILVYFDPDVKFGKEKVGGLRVRNYPPKDAKQEPATNQVSCSICHQYITHADPKIQAATVAKSIEEFGAPVCISCWNKKKAGEV